LRILVVTQHYWPYLGGAAVMLRNLSRYWSLSGHHVEILTTRSQDAYPETETVDGVQVTRLPRPRVRVAGTLRLMAAVRSEVTRRAAGFDVVVASILQHMSAAAIDGALRAGIPVVGRTEGAGRTGDVGWAEQRRFGRRVRALCLRASRLIAVSPEIRRELVAIGYPESRTDLIPNGVPIPSRAWSYDERATYRASLGLDDAPVLCFTGRLLRAKGIPELLGAVGRLKEAGSPCRLVLVGDGLDRDLLSRRSGELGLDGWVRFVGWKEDVEPYLRASDVYVLPSHIEGRSTALLEALALGMPALASDIDANRGLVPADLLPLAPVGDEAALARLLLQRVQAAREWADSGGRRCRALVVEHHSLERAAEGHLAAFRSAGAAA
jgi:glycosyltransferase involved in cell wall biosynthesis